MLRFTKCETARATISRAYSELAPPSLRARTPRIAVVTNGKASWGLSAEARRTGVEFFGGGALVKGLKEASVTIADVCRQDAERYASLKALKSRLAERFG